MLGVGGSVAKARAANVSHDQVDPEQLNRCQHGVFSLTSNGRDECQHDSCDVDRKLKLFMLAFVLIMHDRAHL